MLSLHSKRSITSCCKPSKPGIQSLLRRLSTAPKPYQRITKCRADESADKGTSGDQLEALFKKELEKRGLSVDSASSMDDADQPTTSTKTTGTDPFSKPSATQAEPSTGKRNSAPRTSAAYRSPPPRQPSQADDDQRSKSMALVNEGLEGLIPRASQLLQLGFSVFLAFVPFIVGISLLFGILYAGFGDSFVHGGREGAMPPQYDAEKLLSEPTVDPYIPYYDR